MNNCLCLCREPIKISKNDFIFNYNINCCNNHNNENVDLDYTLSTLKLNNHLNKNQCKEDKKKISMHCFQCNEDICFHCYNKNHKGHKIEYLKSLNSYLSLENITKNNLINERKNLDIFISEFNSFRNKLNFFMDSLKSTLNKLYTFKSELIKAVLDKNYTYIDIENANLICNDNDYKQLYSLTFNFVKSETFLSKFNDLKDIFDLIIKKGKYLEVLNMKNKYLKFKNYEVRPLNNKFLMELNESSLRIKKINSSLKSANFEYDNIFEKKDIIQVVFKEYDNIKDEISFYIIKKTNKLEEIILKNISNKNNINVIINPIKYLDGYDEQLFILSKNKNIIFGNNEINLYDDKFKAKRIIGHYYGKIYICLKLNEETFAYSNEDFYDINIININENKINESIIHNCGNEIINFSEKNNILFSKNDNFIFLINFKSN